jgi:fermentation-respiration switch protein FrsA (DUF1100 family)
VITLYLLLSWLAGRSLYYPIRYPAGDWQAGKTIGARDVWIRDGLHAWFARGPDTRLVTLHLHGNGGNITYRVLSARHILEAGSSVLLLDYRGYGRSSGKPTEEGLYDDAVAAYTWLTRQGYRPEEVVLHGESLGTAVATHVAARKPAAGLILEAPFTSAAAVAGRVLPLAGPVLMRQRYDTASQIGGIQIPVLIIHGDRDEVIAYEFGLELFEKVKSPKKFWRIPNATHNDLHLIGAREFPQRLRDFYASLR